MDDRPFNPDPFMEKPASFCLDEAIRQWRHDLEISRALRKDEVDELEAHLRDAVTAITARGVTTPDAFRVATEQFGPTATIAQEFAKSRPHRQWLGSAFWILAGLLLVKAPLYLGALGFIALLYPIADWTGRSDAAVAIASLGSLLIKAVLVFFFWRLGRVPREKLNTFALMCVRRPLVPILLSSILVVSLNPFFRWVHQVFSATDGSLPDMGLPLVRTISISFYVAEALLWLALPFWLAHLPTGRQKKTNDQDVWLDRCLWISIGVALYAVSAPLLEPVGRITHGLSALVTTNPDCLTVAWAAGKWMAAGALAVAAVSITQAQPVLCQKLKRWIWRHPFFGFVATSILLFVLSWVSSMTAAATTGIPRLSRNAEVLLRDIPSLVFLGALFWLGRHQFIPKPMPQAT
jgi:hypothetical protein